MKMMMTLAALFIFSSGAFAQSLEDRIRILEEAVKKQEQTIREQRKLIDELKAELKASIPLEQRSAVPPKEALPSKSSDALSVKKADGIPVPGTGEKKRDILSYQSGGTTLRLMDISLDALVAAGGSTVRDPQLGILQGGGHDPRKRGFTVQNVELSFMGAVDPYFTGEAHVIYFLDPVAGESQFELEEAFLTTQRLPFGLQLEAGHFFTEFGRVNPQHPHQWSWQDQPIINTRLFGADGMRGPGFRLGWLTPLPWFSEAHFGMQNANGETMASFLANEEIFEERAIGGRPFVDRDVRGFKDFVYLARWDNSWDLSDEWTMKMGLSGLLGPNATGPDGRTWIYGADLKLKWRPVGHFRGWPFLLLEGEIMKRDYRAGRYFDPGPDGEIGTGDEIILSRNVLKDWGLYTQLLYGFRKNWAAGLRYEFAGGSGKNVRVDLSEGSVAFVRRNADPFRDDRYRLSPLIAWHPTEFSRFRLQYNYDRQKALKPRGGHSVWLGMEFMLGAHAAHKY